MVAYAAMMEGQEFRATTAAREMLGSVSDEELEHLGPVYERLFAPMLYEVYIRFGRWDKMLAEPMPHTDVSISTAFWRLGRGIAYAAKKQIKNARAEQAALKEIYSTMPKDESWRGRAGAVLAIGDRMLTGEILYRTGKVDDAILALREAVRLEDKLRYAEPPIWALPVRHALGATLLDAHRYDEASVVYQQDLERCRNNGWSLYGLTRSLQRQGKKAEAAAVADRFASAWQYADFSISSSCCCLPSKENGDGK
jgi:tetratricopeptide (TPR) repeat protein